MGKLTGKMAIMVFFLLFLFSVPLFSQQGEQLTITTYYPSPFGSYQELRVQRMAIGQNFVNRTSICWDPPCPIGSITPPVDSDLIVEGNVGIGARDPNADLVVGNPDSSFGAIISGGPGGGGMFGSNLATNTGVDFYTPYAHLNNYGYSGMHATWGRLDFYTSAGNTVRSQIIAPVSRMRITNLGMVGIGTTNPLNRLHVFTTTSADGFSLDGSINPGITFRTSGTIRGYIGVATAAGAYVAGSSVNDIIYRSQSRNIHFTTNGGTSALMSLTPAGNVGIGTTSPGAKLHVMGFPAGSPCSVIFGSTSQTNVVIDALSTNWGQLFFRGSGVNIWQIQKDTSSNFRITDSFSGQAKIQIQPQATGAVLLVPSGGNVGIGTASPTARLDVRGGDIISAFRVVGRSNTAVGCLGYNDTIFNVRSGVYGNSGSEGWAGYFQGNVRIVGSHPDLAEIVPVGESVEKGDVVVIDEHVKNSFIKSNFAYSSKVGGVISDDPSQIIEGKDTVDLPGNKKALLALAGRVKCKVTAENSPISIGDILVSSSKPGFAMKADLDKVKPGMIIGKALEILEKGEGKILILVE